MIRFLFFLFVFSSCVVISIPSDSPGHDELVDRVYLFCKDLGQDENLVPRSEVYISVDGVDTIIGDCQSCATIQREFYTSFDIPKKAISACGGWYAGSGDYYYVIGNGYWVDVFVKRPDETDTVEVEWQLFNSYLLK